MYTCIYTQKHSQTTTHIRRILYVRRTNSHTHNYPHTLAHTHTHTYTYTHTHNHIQTPTLSRI